MIHHLKGTLIEKSPSHAIMECAGIGYYLHISLTTYGQMADGDIRLFTHPVYREDAQLLYGFATTGERDVFLLLLSVSGVGANTARMILSALTPSETVQTIASGDSGSLQKIKGIGAKTAQRIVVDLRDKIARANVSESMSGSTGGSLRMESIEALMVLGFSRPAVEKVVAKVIAEEEATELEAVIKSALSKL
ncbi:MAG: Holliday junction branch migration protein RuvA [Schleiferiaceae bacterium]|jgi:Holliday junction DNA helicase RuvA|nr:Holliday junction branch migration protein RuvA [Flavobacteriales bacterium]MDE0791884.1 Holliday junction branch migration protein RuvA [Schleiferiaceae bacterium]NCF57302.1 Holliday junction branch migration protein RuvA [Bacteroidota bacterium]NCG44123.1 Holliday junction branch migration protein RuvA [Pseudomonadota bacterium]MDO7566701.1 Holliday junction branch migration protein RuvA [Schleiferiaceae bacterium]|tara:strand:- start:2405 stop:2983 length:579 start_codon:yes stop_codon:yes gene_type:complete